MKHLKFFVFLCILTFTVSCGQQKKYIQYKVKEGESIGEIAKKLDMKTKDLLRLNPDVDKNPDANTVIIIPNKNMNSVSNSISKEKNENATEDNSKVKETENLDVDLISEKEKQRSLLISELEKEFKIHEVKKGDTFFSLTRFYSVSREELIKLNPELKDGLKLGQLIKIMPVEDVFEEELVYVDEIKDGVSINAAILLPFRAQELEAKTSDEIFGNSRLANIVTDLYLGAEIAIDSLRKQGVELNVEVFDTGRNSTKIKTIVAENNLKKKDVIIGPLYSEEVEYVADNVNAPIVFPVYSKKQSKFSSSRIIKTSPNKKLFRDKLLSYIEESFHDGNIIIVGDGKSTSNFDSNKIREVLKSHDSINSVSLITPKDGYIKKQKFTDVLKPNMKNIVVLTTSDKIIIASVINSLISLPEETTASLFTFDKVSAFDKIDNSKLAKLGFTYVSDEYVREDSYSAMAFNKSYLAKNGVLPSAYATKGFDVTYDILVRLASGKSLKSTFDDGYSYRVESKFDYTDKLFKIVENKGLFIVKYNEDLTLTRIK